MAARLEIARRNEAIAGSSEPASVLAARHGLTTGAIHRIRAEYQAPPLTRKQRFQIEVLEGGWRAACMDDEEWTDWVERNPQQLTDGAFAERPCRDCPASFATEMRALGRCNGMPSGSEGEPADHSEEEDDVIDPRPGGVRGAPQPLALSMPPCDSCLHEPICVLKHALKKVTTVEATPLGLPDGLTVAIEAKVECRFYTKKKVPRVLSEAGREAMRDSGRRLAERQAAKRASA